MEERVRLRNVLNAYLSLEELKSLCFDLGIDYDALPGSSKNEKAIELIGHLERRGGSWSLIDRLKELRPHAFLGVELERLVDNGDVKAIKRFLARNRSIVAQIGSSPLEWTFVSFQFGDANEYSADFALLQEGTVPIPCLVALGSPIVSSATVTEVAEMLTTMEKWVAWGREHPDRFVKLFWERAEAQAQDSARTWFEPKAIEWVGIGYQLIAGRRQSNREDRDKYPQLHPGDWSHIISYDRLIEYAQRIVRDVENT